MCCCFIVVSRVIVSCAPFSAGACVVVTVVPGCPSRVGIVVLWGCGIVVLWYCGNVVL